MKISPIYLLLPLILSVSLAFMLPVATPNNALIFASGTVKMKDMVIFYIKKNFVNYFISKDKHWYCNEYFRFVYSLSCRKYLVEISFRCFIFVKHFNQ